MLELRSIVEQQGSSIAKIESEMQNLKASTQTEIGNLTSEIQTLKVSGFTRYSFNALLEFTR